MSTANTTGMIARIQNWFPEREFFMRSQGQVRFITITSRMQMFAAGFVLAVLVGWAGSMAAVAYIQWANGFDRDQLMAREARVATAEERVDAYRADIDAVADDLSERQDFIEAMWNSMPEDVKVDVAAEEASEAAKTVSKVSAALPEAASLARIEARQLAFVRKLTDYADRRAARAAVALKTLGLDPTRMVGRVDSTAMGGPFELLVGSDAKPLDPRFERLGLSLARMSALENVLDGVPQVTPASMKAITSGFGYRRDPFNRRGAMHSGLDFRGPTGTPIYAAAKGKVTFVGWKGGYGKTVEIRHGNGMMTRYAHMSKFEAKVGQQVEGGETIGAIGNTGRSTGPHLHFEVRINNRAVNPRPFLESAPHVLEEVRNNDHVHSGRAG